MRVVGEHPSVCGLQPQSLFLSVCLFPLLHRPLWRKVPQTGYELIPEYAFSVNFWRCSQEWSQSEIFEGQRVTERTLSGPSSQLCILILTTSPKIQSALWSTENLSPHLVKICLSAVFILNGHQVLTQRLFCCGCCLTDVFFSLWG